MNGLMLAARYCLVPARLGICTQKEGDCEALRSYLIEPNKGNEVKAREVLEGFPVVFPYLRVIARENGITDPFDKKVVEAYFVGNELTERVPFSATAEMMRESFPKIGFLAQQEIEARISKLPRTYKPHHNFHTFCFGSATGNLDYGNPSLLHLVLSQCQISWGRVTRVSKAAVVVGNMPMLVLDKKGLSLSLEQGGNILRHNSATIASPNRGDMVTVHWERFCQTINRSQHQSLQNYTNRALIASNLWGEQ